MNDVATSKPFLHDARALLGLSIPLIFSHAGTQLMSIVDTAMVGRLGSAELGGSGIGNALFFGITLIGAGILFGMDPLVSQAIGAQDHERAERILNQGIRLAIKIAMPLSIGLLVAVALLPLTSVEPSTCKSAQHLLLGRLFNTLPLLLFFAYRSYLQAIQHTRPIVVAMITGNITNFLLNALFIFGDASLTRIHLPAIGLPAMGVLGSGISTTLSTIGSALILRVAVNRSRHNKTLSASTNDKDYERNIFRIGLPIGLQLFAEVGIFTIAGILIGTLGDISSAAHQTALTIASFSFTMALGVSSATSVRVGNALGQNNALRARRAGTIGLLITGCFMSVSAFMFWTFPEFLASILTNQSDCITAAIPLIHIAAVFQLADGTQTVAAGALRGAGETKWSQRANVVSYYLIALPLMIFLGFYLKLGAVGVWWSLSIGLICVAVSLCYRFYTVKLRPIEDQL